MQVHVEHDWIESIKVRPDNDDVAEAFARHVEDFTGNYEETALIQGSDNVSSFYDQLDQQEVEMLERGHGILVDLDPWYVGHLYGYDAHTLVESGEIGDMLSNDDNDNAPRPAPSM